MYSLKTTLICEHFRLTQNGVQDVFRFVTFVLQYVTYIAQCVLSLFQEPKSKYSVIDPSQVSALYMVIVIVKR